MRKHTTPPSLMLALLAATFLTPPGMARAAPGDAVGREFRVNTATTLSQALPSVAMEADGDFVVAWVSTDARDGSSWGIFAQRYDAAGAAQGGDFQVNSFTTGIQEHPAVAMDADGDFVVAWSSEGQDGSGYGVFAQRFDAAGAAQGPEFQVNSFTTDTQRLPAVAMDADGDFVVAWQSFGQDGAGYGIFAQRFDAAGAPQGAEFQVNSFTTSDQRFPAVAMDAEGDFVVVWAGQGPGDADGIFALRFDAAGVPQGSEFRVNSFTTSHQADPTVAMDADGDFVVAWQSFGQDGSGYGVFARRYDAAGAAQGLEFQVNSFTTSHQTDPTVAMDADGDFVVAWVSYRQDNPAAYDAGIFAQRFDAVGVAQGAEFQVNTSTTDDQFRSNVAMDADGDFLVAWGDKTSFYGLGVYGSVFAQRFDGVERVAADFGGDGKADILWRRSDNGNTSLWLLDGVTRLSAAPTANPGTDWQIAGTGDFNGDAKTDVLWRRTDNGNTSLWLMDGATRLAAGPLGNPGTVWTVEALRDTNGDGLSDIVWRHGGNAKIVVWQMSGFTRLDQATVGNAGSVWQVQ